MTDKKLDEKVLEETGKQIAEYLKTNCHPYTTVIITAERVTVVEDVLSIPIKIDGRTISQAVQKSICGTTLKDACSS